MSGRVFILGAGASRSDTATRAIPLPLAREFFKPHYLDEHWPGRPGLSRHFQGSELQKLVDSYFSKTTDINASRSDVNVEEVYSFIETYRTLYMSRAYQPQVVLDRARAELLYDIEFVVKYCSFGVKSPVLNGRLAKILAPGDSIISFNWDTLTERALRKSKEGRALLRRFDAIASPGKGALEGTNPSAALSDMHAGYFLKMHGGVNMTKCINEHCLRYRYPYVWPDDEEFVDGWACNQCGSRTEIMILPPHIHKTYSGNRFFRLQASIAAQKLRLADEVVVIGYSFPTFDFEASAMMRCARSDFCEEADDLGPFQNRLVLVNPACHEMNYIERAKDLFSVAAMGAGQIEVVCYKTVGDYLQAEMRSRSKQPKASSVTNQL